MSGLVNDIKRKIPWYGSDFKDSLHIQCLAAFVYVFLGTFTPNVTFGGLLGQATDQYMVSSAWADPEGSRQGVWTPPENSQKYRVSEQYWSGFPEKSQSY